MSKSWSTGLQCCHCDASCDHSLETDTPENCAAKYYGPGHGNEYTNAPTPKLTAQPTTKPTNRPSVSKTNKPTIKPSAQPVQQPSKAPIAPPTPKAESKDEAVDETCMNSDDDPSVEIGNFKQHDDPFALHVDENLHLVKL